MKQGFMIQDASLGVHLVFIYMRHEILKLRCEKKR
jgi:hypothetical protein